MGRRNEPAVILLVEDDPGDQELIRRALLDGEVEAELHIVEDGEAALDYLFRRGRYIHPYLYPMPELILLDFNLPKLNGVQVLGKVKKDARLRRIPVVVLSTSQQEKDVLQCYDSGANSYIVKPVALDGFIHMLRRIDEYWFQTVQLSLGGECPCPPSV